MATTAPTWSATSRKHAQLAMRITRNARDRFTFRISSNLGSARPVSSRAAAARPGLEKRGDLLVTATDHGCDPTWRGTDHTREQVAILMSSERVTSRVGQRFGFSDVAARVARHLELRPPLHGVPF